MPKKPKGELQQLQALFSQVELTKNVPPIFKLLYKHATTYMKSTGKSIQIPCDRDVFGVEKKIYVLAENVVSLLEFNMIGQSAISAYMA